MTYSWIKSDSWIGSESENHTLEYKLNSSSTEKGDATAQYDLGVSYYNGQGEIGKSMGELFNLGLSYYNGQGVEQDYAEAAKYFRKAAEQGHVSAQNNLGVMYANGQGVTKDNYEAVKWFRKAAAQGDENVKAKANNALKTLGY
jgi:TPR repeat protein